jgi:hypothetical protein
MDKSNLRWEAGTGWISAKSDSVGQRHWLGDKFRFDVARKVGTTPRERLKWLARDFLQINYGKLDGVAVPEDVVLELAVFVLYEGGPGTVNLALLPPLSSKRLVKLSREVREGLERFVDGGMWELNLNQRLVRRVSRYVHEFPPDQGKVEIRSTWSREWQISDAAAFNTVFLLTAQDLLVREGEWLARCQFEDCHTLFVKDDVRQKYCTGRHAAKDRVYRYRTGRSAIDKEKP